VQVFGAGTMAWPKSLWVVMQRNRGMKNKRKKYNFNIFIPEGDILEEETGRNETSRSI